MRAEFGHFDADLCAAAVEFAGALVVERNFVFGAVDFKRGQVQLVLILADFGVEFVVALAETVLFAFLLLNGLRVLRFGCGKFSELRGDAFGFGFKLACFACQHLADDSAHLLANLCVAASFGGLTLERAELFFDFDDDVVDA